MTKKRLFCKFGNVRDLIAFCSLGISQKTSFIPVFLGNEDGNNQEAVGGENITCFGKH